MSDVLVAHHRRTLAYDDWANAETLAALRTWEAEQRRRSRRGDGAARTTDRALQRTRRLLAHIVAGERLWLARIAGERPRLPVWPDLGLDDCEEELAAVARDWHALFATLPRRGLARAVPYVNSLSERWTNTVGDIVTHVVVHSAYHRGQIATLMRDAGAEPAYTDYIHCVRQGWIAAASPGTRATRVNGRRARRRAPAEPPSAPATVRRGSPRQTTPPRRSARRAGSRRRAQQS